YLDLSGSVEELKLAAEGTADALRLVGEVRTSPLTINGETFRPAATRFSYRPDLATVTDLALQAERGGTLRIPALAWFPGGGPAQTADDLLRELAGSAGITDLPLAVARSLVRESPYARSAGGETLAKWLER